MVPIFLSVGSNIDPEANVAAGLQLLGRAVKIVRISTFYATEALDRPEQPPFYNGVVAGETQISPRDLKYHILRGIEAQLGRQRTADKYAPRTIDLDVLVYGDWVQDTDDLVLPDAEIPERPFLAWPLFELAPDLVLPGSNRSLREIAAAFSDHAMRPLPAYTAQLRKEIFHEHPESGATDTGTAP